MIITFNHVTKFYNQWKALNDVHFRVEKGEFLFLTGPSGAGKTTLLKMLYMEEKPDSGEVLISFNKDLTYRSGESHLSHVQKLRQKLGIVFQDFKLLPDRNIFDNVAFALRVSGYSSRKIKLRVYEVLTYCGIVHKAKALPSALSGGEQQRVCIARAMVNEPYIMIADEPTGNLDLDTAWEIMEIFKNINASGTAIIMATHNLSLVEKLPFNRLILNNGRVMNRNYI